MGSAVGRICKGCQPIYGYKLSGQRFDCGDKAGFLMANISFALNRATCAVL